MICPNCEGERDDDWKRPNPNRCNWTESYACETCEDAGHILTAARELNIDDMTSIVAADESILLAALVEEDGFDVVLEDIRRYASRSATQYWPGIEAKLIALFGTAEDTEIFEAAQ